MFGHIRERAESQPVIVDHLIASPYIYRMALEKFAGLQVFWVHVVCPVAILRAREDARNSPLKGAAEFWQEHVTPVTRYDLVVDTSVDPAEAVAQRITVGLHHHDPAPLHVPSARVAHRRPLPASLTPCD